MSKEIRDAIMDEPEAKPAALYFSTGCTLLDLTVGGGFGLGFPAGVIVNIVGDKSAGKSFLKNETLATNYWRYGAKRFKWFSDDTETGDTFDTSALYGVNLVPEERKLGKTIVGHSETVEELDAKLGMFLDTIGKDQCGIYAVDSLDGLGDASKTKKESERQKQLEAGKEIADKGDYGMQLPKFLSQELFKTKHSQLKEKNVLLLIISQIRDKVDAMGFGQKWDVSGGKALEFYAHTRLFLTTIRKITKNGLAVGAYVEAKTTKSKTPRPFRSCRFTVYFDYGIDEIGSCLDYLYDLRAEDGKLLVAANEIPWDAKKQANLASITEWLKSIDKYEAAKEAKRTETGKYQLSLDWVNDWIHSQPELREEYMAEFGQCYHRDYLIKQIEEDPKMLEELRRRTIEKWEAAEAAVRSERKPKFAGQNTTNNSQGLASAPKTKETPK